MADGDSRVWATVKKYAKRFWEYLKAAKMEYIVMISLFALDLISKAIADVTLKTSGVVPIIPHFISFNYSLNKNAAFGNTIIGEWLGNLGSRIFFSIFAVAASVVFVIILVKHKGGNKLFRVALAMITAGAMGNCIDRMFLGYVRDFIQFEFSFFPYIFNVADIELVVGVILMLVFFLFMYRDHDDKKHHGKHSDGEQTPNEENAEETAEETDAATEAETTETTETSTEENGSADATESETSTEETAAADATEGETVETSDGTAETASEPDETNAEGA